jgi:hypothetical protein
MISDRAVHQHRGQCITFIQKALNTSGYIKNFWMIFTQLLGTSTSSSVAFLHMTVK